MLRTIAAIPLVALWTLGFSILGLVAGLLDRTGRLPHRLARVWARVLLAICGVRVLVSGIENLPSGAAVYAANHGSALDIPILFGHLPVDFRIIHKRSLSLLPLVGWYLYLAHHVAIDRANPFRATRSLEAATGRIRGGTSVAVFPEGTRSPDEGVRLFKRGSIVLALGAGAPVVPVSLVGVKQVVPRGILTLRSGAIAMRIHPAVPTAGRRPDEAEALADEVRRIVIRGCQEAP